MEKEIGFSWVSFWSSEYTGKISSDPGNVAMERRHVVAMQTEYF
jgi:hypothetical protein